VAYNSLLIERRKLLHERAGEALEALFTGRLEDHLDELAHHYSRSDNIAKAVEYLERAGQHSAESAIAASALSSPTPSPTPTPTLTPMPPNACLPSSSLSVLVKGTTVDSYVPNGRWGQGPVNVQRVPIEGSNARATIVTPNAANSCSSNSTTGETVCTANNTDVYLINGSALTNTLTSGATGAANFSGGVCQNCGVIVDATTNTAWLGISTTTGPRISPWISVWGIL
jgi:hypothetical protein